MSSINLCWMDHFLKYLQVLDHPFIKSGPNAPDKNLNDVITGRLKNFQGQNKLKRQAFRLISENLAANQIAGL